MSKSKLQQIENRITKIKNELMTIGEMRPGSITRQFKDPVKKIGGAYQISYTHRMKSRTEYVRPRFVKVLEKQVASFAKYKKLTQEWVDLAIEYSKEKIRLAILEENGLS
jgi:hypothetical protein